MLPVQSPPVAIEQCHAKVKPIHCRNRGEERQPAKHRPPPMGVRPPGRGQQKKGSDRLNKSDPVHRGEPQKRDDERRADKHLRERQPPPQVFLPPRGRGIRETSALQATAPNRPPRVATRRRSGTAPWIGRHTGRETAGRQEISASSRPGTRHSPDRILTQSPRGRPLRQSRQPGSRPDRKTTRLNSSQL